MTITNKLHYNDSFSLYIAAPHTAHVLYILLLLLCVHHTLLAVIIICITFVKLTKCCKVQGVCVHQRIALHKSYLLLLLLSSRPALGRTAPYSNVQLLAHSLLCFRYSQPPDSLHQTPHPIPKSTTYQKSLKKD